jgi:hypothetical protein
VKLLVAASLYDCLLFLLLFAATWDMVFKPGSSAVGRHD